jgi:EAL domain-containing protein (putative c-di-GMP-specific phosphodiesterase class I)
LITGKCYNRQTVTQSTPNVELRIEVIHSLQRRCFLSCFSGCGFTNEIKDGYVARKSLYLDSVDVEYSLANGQFIPYFQPIIILRTGKVAGFEILARWEHPRLGMVAPDAFIPLAERDGWIGQLMQEILRRALVCAAAIPAPLTLALNVSPIQLRDSTLPLQIERELLAAGFSAERLVVEITESALIDNLSHA